MRELSRTRAVRFLAKFYRAIIGNPVTLTYGDSQGEVSVFVEQYTDTVTLAEYTVSGIFLLCADGQRATDNSTN